MSSVRNAAAGSRRAHKERAQPLKRASKFPLLEKKKDYLLRASDYRTKQKHLSNLKVKAKYRNPDEFYFGMIREKTEKGIVVHTRTNNEITEDMLKVLKAQDVGYLRTARRVEKKKIEQMRQLVHGGADVANNHTRFEVENSIDNKVDQLKHSGTAQHRLEAHIERDKKMQIIQQEAQLHRNLMNKGSRKKIKTSSGQHIYKWKSERKK